MYQSRCVHIEKLRKIVTLIRCRAKEGGGVAAKAETNDFFFESGF